jgi:hypothetical protein
MKKVSSSSGFGDVLEPAAMESTAHAAGFQLIQVGVAKWIPEWWNLT